VTSCETNINRPHFVSGSIVRHLLVMALTSSIGTMSLFLVDLAGLYFLAVLKNTAITAAMGYASSIILIAVTAGLGGGVAASALVSSSIGAGDTDKARDYVTSNLLFSLMQGIIIAIVITLFSDNLLLLINAEGEARYLARLYILTVSPSIILAGCTLCLAAILQGLGDPLRAMYVIVTFSLVTIILDPLLIFNLNLGIQGPAIASVMGYFVALCLGLHGVFKVHSAINPIRLSKVWHDFRYIWIIAYPAILSQLTVPLENLFITNVISRFGDAIFAGYAVISRLMPVAFAIAFAMSNAVAPIIGQNFGAGLYKRVRRTLTQSLLISIGYTFGTSFILSALSKQVARVFNAVGNTEDVIVFFCSYLSISYVFVAALRIAQAAFNNLGYPKLSAALSWGRITVGTIPLAYLGAILDGWKGVLTGNAIGAAVFGIIAVLLSYGITNHQSLKSKEPLVRSPTQ